MAEKIKPEVRFLNEMKNVLYDQVWAKTAPNFKLYYVYRRVKRKNGLGYDITVIPPKTLGQEFVKTKGHIHTKPYKELYIVLKGRAIYLLQKSKDKKVKDVYAVKVKKGEAIIIPGDYDHLTINPSQKTLKMANWISEKCKNDYDLFEKNQGACYYYTKLGWIKNKNYRNIPQLRFEKSLKSLPKNLDFLRG